MKNIPIVKPMISNEEINAVVDVIKSGWLVEGKNARELEKEFADFIGIKHAITASSGTTALHLALEALDIKPGDEVITTAFTFIASSNSILFIGGVPVFADISRDTYNIDPDEIKKRITDKTKAILAVHIFGLPSNMKAIREIADEHGLYVIEDCAQSHGAKIDGKHVGTFGDIAAFSLYATKNMISGEGGIVVTNDSDLADKVNSIKNHGRDIHGGYNHYRIGYNFRMTDMQAAIALVQLKKLPEMLKTRARNHKIIREELEDVESIKFQEIPPGYTHANYICAPHIVDDSISVNHVINELKKNGISSRTIYAIPSYKQPAYKNINEWRWAKCVNYPDYSKYHLPNTEFIGSHHFEVPIHAGVTEEDAVYIAETLKKILTKH